MPTIYTIGFSGKNQDEFIETLNAVKIRVLVDIRLWRVARFVPWASGANLAAALGNKYHVMLELAPTKELLTAYRDGQIDWADYERIFNGLLAERQVEKLFTTTPAHSHRPFASKEELDGACFLCTEKSADQCHRRLVAEYLACKFPNIQMMHL